MEFAYWKMIRFVGIFITLFSLPPGRDAYAVRIYFEEIMRGNKDGPNTPIFKSEENVADAMDVGASTMWNTDLIQIKSEVNQLEKRGIFNNCFSGFSRHKSRKPNRTNTHNARPPTIPPPKSSSKTIIVGFPQSKSKGQKTGPRGKKDDRKAWVSFGDHAELLEPPTAYPPPPPTRPPPLFQDEMYTMKELTWGPF